MSRSHLDGNKDAIVVVWCGLSSATEEQRSDEKSRYSVIELHHSKFVSERRIVNWFQQAAFGELRRIGRTDDKDDSSQTSFQSF